MLYYSNMTRVVWKLGEALSVQYNHSICNPIVTYFLFILFIVHVILYTCTKMILYEISDTFIGYPSFCNVLAIYGVLVLDFVVYIYIYIYICHSCVMT